MVRRGREPGLGLWSLPGGRVEQGERIADALRREVKEETGLDVEVGELAGVFEVVGDGHYVVVDHFVSLSSQATPTPGSDASDVRWVPLEEIGDLDCTPRLIETLQSWNALPLAD
jgi:8-oxo-dGTP diphosphatase